jgi:hypothetical protein
MGSKKAEAHMRVANSMTSVTVGISTPKSNSVKPGRFLFGFDGGG